MYLLFHFFFFFFFSLFIVFYYLFHFIPQFDIARFQQVADTNVVWPGVRPTFYFRVPQSNPVDNNCAITTYLQHGEIDVSSVAHLQNKACFDYISVIIQEPFFNQLRTIEALGYVVRAYPTTHYTVAGLNLQIQSALNPRDLANRIHSFLTVTFPPSLTPPEPFFQSRLEVMASTKITPPLSLQDELTALWPEIAKQTYVFNRAQLEANALLSLSPELVTRYYQNFILGGLNILIFGADMKIPIPDAEVGDIYFNNITDFQNIVTFYQ